MNALTRKEPAERSKINVASATEMKSWARKLKVSTEELRSIIEKVGNSAATVRKEIEGQALSARAPQTKRAQEQKSGATVSIPESLCQEDFSCTEPPRL